MRQRQRPSRATGRRRDASAHKTPLRVVIGERETLLREGLALIVRRAGFELAGAAPDADALLGLVAATQPDLVITDIHLPPGRTDDGQPVALEVRRRWPATGVLVLCQQVQHRHLGDLLGAQPTGVGYLLKHRIADVPAFLDAMRTVAGGGAVLEQDVAKVVLDRSDPGLLALTPRQREILALMAEGLSNAGIAARLNLSEKTVVHHCSAIYSALDLLPTIDEHRRVLAVVRHLNAVGERRAGVLTTR